VVASLLQIAEAPGLEDGTCHLVIEFVLTLVTSNTILSMAAELLPSFFSSEDWKRRHAAMVTIAQISESSAKVMIKNLEQVVGMVQNSFQDPHPQVRWAEINAIGQLSTDLGSDLRNQFAPCCATCTSFSNG
jgi:hypothetical protein